MKSGDNCSVDAVLRWSDEWWGRLRSWPLWSKFEDKSKPSVPGSERNHESRLTNFTASQAYRGLPYCRLFSSNNNVLLRWHTFLKLYFYFIFFLLCMCRSENELGGILHLHLADKGTVRHRERDRGKAWALLPPGGSLRQRHGGRGANAFQVLGFLLIAPPLLPQGWLWSLHTFKF